MIPLSLPQPAQADIQERYVIRLHAGQFVTKILTEKLGLSASIESAKLFRSMDVAAHLARLYGGDVIAVLVDRNSQNTRICARRRLQADQPAVPVSDDVIEAVKSSNAYTYQSMLGEIE